LTLQEWRDASLQDIIDAELSPFDHEDRIHLSGPTVRLPAKHALTLTMTLHELATNAAKYGALAHPEGMLHVDWMVKEDAAERRLTVNWIETGVPGAAERAGKESFGARLIRNAAVYDLQGRCDYKIAEDGVKCVISAAF
jgi:two-component sensor histidine kinase